MQIKSRQLATYARDNRRLVAVATIAAVFGMLIGGASSVIGAQSAEEAQTSDVQTYPAPGTTGDRGVEKVYRGQQATSAEVEQGVQRAPAPRSAGDRGVNQPRHVRGEQTQLDVDELQNIVDDLQAMYDDAQSALDARQAALERARWNAAPGTSGDLGINRVYRPEQSAYYIPDYSDDRYRAPAPRTYGDRGASRVYRGERTYRERAAHERAGRNVDLYGLGGFTLPESQVELDAIGAELDELQMRLDEQRARMNTGPRTSGDRGANRVQRGAPASAQEQGVPQRSALRRSQAGDIARPAEPRRYYPAPGTAGDVGVNRIYRDPVLAREQSRLDREQRLLDRGQRKVDRLQRKLDRQVERYARTSAGDRGVTPVTDPAQVPGVERTIGQLFSQLDQDGDRMLSEKEGKRLSIVERNWSDLDRDGDGSVTLSEFSDIIEESEAL